MTATGSPAAIARSRADPPAFVTRLAFALYHTAGLAAEPAVRRLLLARRARGKEHAQRWTERLGAATLARPRGRLAWLHAASIGEALSALPLIERLREQRPDLAVLITTGTVTAATLVAERAPPGVLHQFAPVDLPRAVERFLDAWRPDLALWFESELWPTTLAALRRRAIPAALLNARMSATSLGRWRRLPAAAAALLSTFDPVLAQSGEDALRFRALGADARFVGNLKRSAAPLPHDPAELSRLRAVIGDRPVWLAASTHAGEEAVAAAAHAVLATRRPDLVTVIAPRHPGRGAAIALELAARGPAPDRRSLGAPPRPGAIYLADTLGELGLWFRLAQATFVGNSLNGGGGHNPLEPARLGSALLYGPAMQNFAAIATELERSGGALRIADAGALAGALDRLLDDPAARRTMARAAADYADEQGSAVDSVFAALAPLLPRPSVEDR